MKTVTILMSTYNGEKYINEQIESLLKQTGVKISIVVRDDGSIDSTKNILEQYKKHGVLNWYEGDNLKSARSFLDLIKNVTQDSDYYAFCDQDDWWNSDKLIRAVSSMEEEQYDNIPTLYCSDYQLVDEKLNKLPENGHISTTTFKEALIASNCTGCTTVFNKDLFAILQNSENPNIIVMHDDWVHKVCLAIGGKVIYDKEKTLLYRQHGNNVDGGVHSVSEKICHVIERIIKQDRIRSKQISEIIRIYQDIMPEDNLIMAQKVSNYASYSLVKRIKLVFSKTITTKYPKINKGFRLAILFKYF